MKIKIFVLLTLVLLLLVSFAACGETPEEPNDPNTPDAPAGDEGGGETPEDPEDIEIPRLDFGGVFFTNIGFPYDGEEHSVFVRGNLPDDVTVSYENNGQVEAGSYNVIAKFYYKGKYIEGKDKKAKLTITKAKYDISDLHLFSTCVGYDGQAHSILLEGTLPEGLSVEYVGNGVSEAGEHTVKAVFSGDFQNYVAVEDMVATLNISTGVPAGVSFTEEIFDFDGAQKSVFAKGNLPAGVNVTYTGNGKRSAGVYEVEADFGEGYGKVSVKMTIVEPKSITYAKDDTHGLYFELTKEKVYYVTGYDGTRDYVVIPEKYDGVEVNGISVEAFKGDSGLKFLYIGDNVLNIGTSAFENCTALEEIIFGERLQTIGQKSFANVGAKTIALPSSVAAMGFGSFENTQVEDLTLPFIGGSSFSSNKFLGYIFGAIGYAANKNYVPASLKTLRLNDACREIPAYSLFGCDKIEQVILGSSVEIIGISAFENCTSLKSVFIPKSVKTVYADGYDYNSPFFGCSEDLLIYTEKGFAAKCGKYWLLINETDKLTPITIESYEEYLVLIQPGEAAE